MDVCQWSQIFFCCIGKLIHFRFCTESKVLAYLLVAMQTRDSLTETTFFGSSRQLIFLLRMKLAELIRTMHCHSPELLRLQWNWVSEHFLRKWSWTRILKRFFVLSDVFAWHHRLSNTTVRSEVHYGRLQKHRYLTLSMGKTWFSCRSFGPVLINYLQFRSKLAQVRLQIPES